jgi:hypothetical protein
MGHKNKNPRFAVEGLVKTNQQGNFIKVRQFAQEIHSLITTKIKWYLVLAGTVGVIPRPLCKLLINVLGLKHK